MAVRALEAHTRYRCHDSGVCCSSGWSIPVETTVHRTLEAALAGRTLPVPDRDRPPLIARADLPQDYASVLATRGDGSCVFYDASARRCAIHSALGPLAKPASCRAFPRVLVHDPRATFVSLSHYCPSAADLLFDVDEPPEIVDVDEAAVRDEGLEGLDARAALPPLLREAVLVDWATLTEWEQFEMAVLGSAGPAETAVQVLWAGYRALRNWTARQGPMHERARELLRSHLAGPADAQSPGTDRKRSDTALARAVCSAIPAHLRPMPPRAEPRAVEAWQRLVAPVWPGVAPVLRRYLAARALACWPLYQGNGLITLLVYLEAALALVSWQAIEHVSRTNALLDRHGMREAIRHADLLLVHLAVPEDLARALDRMAVRRR